MNKSDEPPIDRLGIRDRLRTYAINLVSRENGNRGQSGHDTSILPTINQQPNNQDGVLPSDAPGGLGNSAEEPQSLPVSFDITATGAVLVDTQDGKETSAIEKSGPKPGVLERVLTSIKLIVLSSWVNWLLLFVPVGIALGAAQRVMGDRSPISPTIVFSINAVAIIPLAWMLGYATECVAADLGDTIGALLNVTFGNAVELIIFIALVANEITVVQASLLGSILANLLLILGMCFLFGGLRFREQLYNSAVTQMSACLLSLSVISLLLPTAFHASFSNIANADAAVLKVSRGTSVVLLLVYILYLLFQLKSHSYIYASTPQHVIDEESHPGVLAEILNASLSSSESSSDDDSDASSGSQTTVKRIKRALRKKRRRKSSSTSKDTTPLPSLPSFIRTLSSSSQVIDDGATGFSGIKTDTKRNDQEFVIPDREPLHMSPESSGEVMTRDFEVDQEPSKSEEPKRKASYLQKQHKEAKSRRSEEDIIEEVLSAAGPSLVTGGGGESAKRSLNLRDIPHKAKLTRVINSNDFSLSHAQPNLSLNIPGNHLRRTSSLPDRLNRANPKEAPAATPAAITTAIPSAQPLPHLVSMKRIEIKDDPDEKPKLDRTTALVLLLITTGLVAVCAEFLVNSIDYLVSTTGVSEVFIGLIVLPIVGNAAEHVTAVTVASKNKMDLAIGVALGSSIQIALFVTPVIVLLGWILNREMSLYFSLFETVSLFASAFIVNYLMLDGRSNYLEGALLIAAYVMIGVSAFFYPSCGNTNTLNSGTMDGSC